MNAYHSGNPTILVKYKGPTNHSGAHMRVTRCWTSSRECKKYPYCHELSASDNYIYAAKLFCQHMGWDGDLIGGDALKGGVVFLFTDFVYANKVVKA
jgi:hypothetical protein